MRIQHNIAALNSYRQLSGNNNALSKNLEKLSSGYRINRAGDDAAGLAISEKMRAQIKGLEVAQKNANDGISLVQTAEGALTEVHSMLNRMVELATQSANGTYDNETSRANLQKEVNSLLEEIDRISKSTNFNSINLLDGSMDGDATATTGGTTDVPILQNAATDPSTEVGKATVLHKDGQKLGKTEINIDLHNTAITGKSQVGDIVKITVGDAEIELDVTQAGGGNDITAGTPLKASDLATLIQNKFNSDVQLIGGQKFTASAVNGKITFIQDNDPQDPTEVVDANVDVKIEYVTNPSGNPVEYKTQIKNDHLKPGATISIGGDEYVIGEDDLAGCNDLATAFGAGIETPSGYKVEYDSTTSTLKVTDPNGTLGAPVVKYDDYASPTGIKASATPAKNDIKSTTTVAFSDLGIIGAPKADDTITIGTDTFTFDGTSKWVSADPDNAEYTITSDANGLKIASTADGSAGDGTLAIGGITFNADAGNTVDLSVTTAGGTANAAGTSAASTGSLTLAGAAKENDTIEIEGITFTRNAAGAWNTTDTNTDNWAITETTDANGNSVLAFSAGDTTTANTADNTGLNAAHAITYSPVGDRTNATAADLTGGVDSTSAKTTIDKMADGNKIKFTSDDGATSVEFIYDTDWATTLAKNIDVNGTAMTVKDAIESIANTTTGLTNGETFTASAVNGKLVIESSESGKAGTDAAGTVEGSHTPKFKATVEIKSTKTAEMKAPADAANITGTWNVQSLQNTQGASEGGGQLASTVFDLTADMVKDGNTLTIGKDTYVFKVGKDSTTEAAAGQTLIDLSQYAADDPELIDRAGETLANQTNKAFTIGYADHGKISIHEIEGQTAFKDGELNTIESFDKLVYMTSPSETKSTGRGLTLQVGDTADDFQKVSLNIKDMSSKGLGLSGISVATQDDASAAIDKIKAAINSVSSTRGDLGAVQNRLEHTINNLGVTTENLTAAESRIRDTDMAEEMMNYTKNNILVQAAQAMLAQANTVPQGVLQLLQ